MDVLARMRACGIVPVVVLENADDAVETAKAMLRGGVDLMEITFRTAAAPESIRRVAQQVPDMLVGAGTVVTLDQCKEAVACGAKFIVSPGFDEEVVAWCCERGIPVTPGCVTPTEIMGALKHGPQILPGQRLWRTCRPQVPFGALRRREVYPHRRRRPGEPGRVCGRTHGPCRGRQLGLPQGRYHGPWL